MRKKVLCELRKLEGISNKLSALHPSVPTAQKQRQTNVDATHWRCIDADSTPPKHHRPSEMQQHMKTKLNIEFEEHTGTETEWGPERSKAHCAHIANTFLLPINNAYAN